MKKLLSAFLCLSLIFTLAVPAFAVETSPKELQSSTAIILSDASESPDIQPNSVATAAVKKAIRWALRHSDDIVRSAAKWIGPEAAAVVSSNFSKAEPVLRELLKWDTLVWQTIQDQLTHVVGSQAAVFFRMALEFLL